MERGREGESEWVERGRGGGWREGRGEWREEMRRKKDVGR